jgi:hypothetical protein
MLSLSIIIGVVNVIMDERNFVCLFVCLFKLSSFGSSEAVRKWMAEKAATSYVAQLSRKLFSLSSDGGDLTFESSHIYYPKIDSSPKNSTFRNVSPRSKLVFEKEVR